MDRVEVATIGDVEAVGGGRDRLRRAVLTALALYLVPAALAVLLIGAVGLACCALIRLIDGPRRPVATGRSRRPDRPDGRIGRGPHAAVRVGQRAPG